jgi:hypothetical protein
VIDALGKYSVDENGVEWNKLTLAEKEKTAKNAKEKFEKDKANWEISAMNKTEKTINYTRKIVTYLMEINR